MIIYDNFRYFSLNGQHEYMKLSYYHIATNTDTHTHTQLYNKLLNWMEYGERICDISRSFFLFLFFSLLHAKLTATKTTFNLVGQKKASFICWIHWTDLFSGFFSGFVFVSVAVAYFVTIAGFE